MSKLFLFSHLFFSKTYYALTLIRLVIGDIVHTAKIIITFDESQTASIIYASLLPELSKNIPQTNVNITHLKNTLIVSISAQTTPVLRAVINSYSRWIQTAVQVQKINKK
jgi:tRNA threonylcarbamoyladenosine modification (KEOPS) complex  Pcc1 subunit